MGADHPGNGVLIARLSTVLKALRDAVSEVEARFASPKGKVNSKFKL